MTVRTFNLATGDWASTFSCPPRDAVIAAHAQSLGDWNTWDYEKNYGHLVATGATFYRCGSFTAFKDPE